MHLPLTRIKRTKSTNQKFNIAFVDLRDTEVAQSVYGLKYISRTERDAKEVHSNSDYEQHKTSSTPYIK